MPVISRHRLPEPYRSLLCGLWLTPPALMFLTLIKLNGLTWAVFHPLTLLAGVLMALPAWYVWQQGVDVMPDALHIRITGWRRRTFDQLDTWTLAPNPPDEPILLVWDRQRRRVIDTHSAHLSDLTLLVRTLKTRVGGGQRE